MLFFNTRKCKKAAIAKEQSPRVNCLTPGPTKSHPEHTCPPRASFPVSLTIIICSCPCTACVNFLRNILASFHYFFCFISLLFFYFWGALLTWALISRAHVGRGRTPAGRGEPARQRPQTRPRARDRACPPRLAVCAAMAAAAPSAWLTLQPAARTLRAFSSAVSPATVAQKSRPRECLMRHFQALGRREGGISDPRWPPRWRSQRRPAGRYILC